MSNKHQHCPIRLKPVHKIEGMTNGTAAAAGQQQQQQQQGSGQVDISTQVQQYQQFLGEDSKPFQPPFEFVTCCPPPPSDLTSTPPAFADASRALPEFPEIDLQGKSLPEGVELEHIKSFQLLYREHCEVKPTRPQTRIAQNLRIEGI